MTAVSSISVERPEKPYPGLRPFEASEWSIFFGRERMIEDVIERLAQNRLVLIHGASGSGKSSLVRAGVMPKLARQHRRHGALWLTCAMRPAGGPLWNLASELVRLEGRGGDVERIGAIANAFNRRDASFAQVVGGIDALAGQSLCILVDQFEELFRFEKEASREEAELFVDLIARATRHDDQSNVHVVVTMRSEFLGQCARFAGLAEVINKTQYLVPRMDDDALLRAVRRPAQLFKGFVGEDLAYRLIARVRGREDELPLLQHGLMLMWDEAATKPAEDGRIVLGGTMVEKAGGLAELLSNHADRIADAVAPDPRRAKIVERVFRALTDVNAEGAAIRRPQCCADLAAVAGTTFDELMPILNAFRAADVSFLTPYAPASLKESSIVDISHEALIRCWRRIGSGQEGWLKHELDDGLAWRSLLSEAEAFAKNPQRVLSPAATEDRGGLVAARNETWARRYGGGWPLVDKLLEASRKSAARTRRRARTAMASLAGLAIGAIGLAFATNFAWQQSKTTNEKYLQQSEVVSKLFENITNIGNPRQDSEAALSQLFQETKAAAERGNTIASYTLGIFYYAGLGTPADPAKAFEAFTTAANTGHVGAMRNVGLSYAFAKGVRQDYGKAREWLDKAAAKGDAKAMAALGYLDENGYGAARDVAKARGWYEKAAAAGDRDAATNVGLLYEEGEGAPKDSAKAREWFEKAGANDPSTMRKLGEKYENGRGVSQDYTKAREWYEKAAAAGDGTAMLDLGQLYYNGNGLPEDYVKAREWYEKAAAAGETTAMVYVGDLYREGEGTGEDYAKARQWYDKAAALGNSDAMYDLGEIYENGNGVPEDYVKARGWYEKASAAGDASAMANIGDFYRDGKGAPVDFSKARQWYERAVAAGHADAMESIGDLYKSGGKGLSKDLGKAMDWYQKAVKAGNTTVAFDVGKFYEDGDGLPQDYIQARKWYEKSAASGDATAMLYIGDFFRDGHGTPIDFVAARQWYEKAAAGKDTTAMMSLGDLYKEGQGTPKDLGKAREWYEKAAAENETSGMIAVGDLYYNGEGSAKDYVKAREWYLKAAAADDATAMRFLGELYENGYGVQKDYAAARKWYKKAADNDDVDAMRSLGDFYRDGKGVPKSRMKAQEWYDKADDAEAKAKEDKKSDNDDGKADKE